jgi:hypothetical protein
VLGAKSICHVGSACGANGEAPSGIAIRSEYGRLKSALAGFLDDVHLGKVRYGDQEMTGYNALQILSTKGRGYEWESEIRAVVCSYDPVDGQARNYREALFPHREPQDDLNPIHPWVYVCKRRRLLRNDLLLGIAVSPWTSDETLEEVGGSWANVRGQGLRIVHDLKSPLTPTLGELNSRGWSPNGDEPN